MTYVKITKMAIHNFMSFKDEEWDFDKTSKLVLVKGINRDTGTSKGNTSNGSGKSTWSHALMYALFGQLPGKFHVSNLQNLFSNDYKNGYRMYVSVEVEVTISSGEKRNWRIIRGLQKTQSAVLQLLSYDEDEQVWKDISKSSTANTQKFIEDNVLMMNFEMYQRVVMLSVDDKFNFFKMNAAQKREFVETLLDTSIYSKMFKMMSDDIKSKNMVLQNLKSNQVKLAKSKEVCEDEIAKYKANVNVKIDECEKERLEYDTKANELIPSIEDMKGRKHNIQSEIDKINANKVRVDDAIKTLNNKVTESKVEISKCNATISHHERELDKHKEVLGMICDDCKQIVNNFYSLDAYRNQIDELKLKIDEINVEIGGIQSKISKLQECSDTLKQQEKNKNHEMNDILVSERNLTFQRSQILNSIASVERKISELKESIENDEKIPSYSIYKNTISELDSVDKSLKDTVETICHLKVGAALVSPDAIKANIISRVVSSINSMINANLSELSVNFACQLASDMNDYSIISGGQEVDLTLRSTGEQMKLLISSQLAFRRFLMSRFNVGINLMIIDEVVDKALDSVSIHTLLEMLLRLSQKENTNVSVISHRTEIEDMFNDISDTQLVVIQKENNVSRILRD